jgi:hypothetical protein
VNQLRAALTIHRTAAMNDAQRRAAEIAERRRESIHGLLCALCGSALIVVIVIV